MKIVTHNNPDLDAVISCWLLKRFLPGWEEAEIVFCEPNSTIDENPVDSNPNILYVDVGEGKLDHHQHSDRTSAGTLVYKFIDKKLKDTGQDFKKLDKKALDQIIQVSTEIDNAGDLLWEESAKPRNYFYLHILIAGVRGMGEDDEKVIEFSFLALDSLFHEIKKGIDARDELEKGIEFESPWGKSIAIETGNDNVLWEGERAGYSVVIRKDSKNGNVRIYSRFDRGVDLTKAYKKIKKIDKNADWYFHSSKVLLLNGSKMKEMKPTSLSLGEIINILKK
ncbi:hypothetical protein KKF11_00480 [Patescibacteria group bacterium]|nr:hypothetical protein [Patescibacteria group bacterium]